MELMMAIAVIGVILAVTIPSFNTFRLNNRMTGAANDLLASFNLARSEAVKRQRSVGVCSSTDPGAATPTCTAPLLNTTSVGWVVWLDQNANAALDAGEEILSSHDTLDPALVLTSNWQAIRYAPTGFIVVTPALPPSTPASTLLCDQRLNAGDGVQIRRRVLTVSPTGRPAVLRTAAALTVLVPFSPVVVTDC